MGGVGGRAAHDETSKWADFTNLTALDGLTVSVTVQRLKMLNAEDPDKGWKPYCRPKAPPVPETSHKLFIIATYSEH